MTVPRGARRPLTVVAVPAAQSNVGQRFGRVGRRPPQDRRPRYRSRRRHRSGGAPAGDRRRRLDCACRSRRRGAGVGVEIAPSVRLTDWTASPRDRPSGVRLVMWPGSGQTKSTNESPHGVNSFVLSPSRKGDHHPSNCLDRRDYGQLSRRRCSDALHLLRASTRPSQDATTRSVRRVRQCESRGPIHRTPGLARRSHDTEECRSDAAPLAPWSVVRSRSVTPRPCVQAQQRDDRCGMSELRCLHSRATPMSLPAGRSRRRWIAFSERCFPRRPACTHPGGTAAYAQNRRTHRSCDPLGGADGQDALHLQPLREDLEHE